MRPGGAQGRPDRRRRRVPRPASSPALAWGLPLERCAAGRLAARDVRHRDRGHPGVRAGPARASSSASATPTARTPWPTSRRTCAARVPDAPRPRAASPWNRRSSRRRRATPSATLDALPRRARSCVGARRRPRAGHRARGLPRRRCSRCRSRGAAPVGWWSPDPRGVLAARRPAGQPVAAGVLPAVRDPGRHGVRRRGPRLRRPEAAGRLDPPGRRRGVPPAARARLGAQRRGLVGRRRRRERLAGGLYGVAVGGLFAGESMFHRERDASKVALVGARRAAAARATARRAATGCSTCSGPPTTWRRWAPSRSAAADYLDAARRGAAAAAGVARTDRVRSRVLRRRQTDTPGSVRPLAARPGRLE